MARITIREVMDKLNDVKDDVASHDTWINGNGEDGAKTSMRLIEDRVGRIERWNYAIILAVVVDFIRSFFP